MIMKILNMSNFFIVFFDSYKYTFFSVSNKYINCMCNIIIIFAKIKFEFSTKYFST